MNNASKRIFALGLALLLAVGLFPIMELGAAAQGQKIIAQVNAGIGTQAVQPATAKTGDDGTTNWDFIEPVTHLKTVPAGYTGIYTAQDLDNVRKNLSGNYILMANIDLKSWGDWEPIGRDRNAAYQGNFDGNGYVVKNMTVNIASTSTTAYVGLFGYCTKGTIKNLGRLGGSVNASSAIAGGIAGYSSSSISNCYNTGNVSASSTSDSSPHAGGIVGGHSSTIINCYNTGAVSAASSSYSSYPHAGGIAGYSGSESTVSTIINCYNTGSVNASSYSCYSYAGGIAGDSSSAISNCYNTGDVSASSYSTADYPYYYYCHSHAGGIVGISYSSSSISNCYNTGDVSSAYPSSYSHPCFSGGIAGYLSSPSTISNCYNTGKVSASSTYSSYAGGIAGYSGSGSTINNCYNTGSVNASSTASSSFAGGIVGSAHSLASISEISNCRNCYNIGNVSASYAGGLIGYSDSDSTISNCYYKNTALKAVGNDSGTLGNVRVLRDAQMKQQASFVGFDFNTVWRMGASGYPEFTSLHVHSFNSWTTKTAATCTAIGTQTRSCTCGETETKTLAKLAHTGGTAICKAKAKCTRCKAEYGSLATHKEKAAVTKATTTKDGKTNTICSVCNKTLKTGAVIPKASSIALSATSYVYDGKEKKPSVTVKDSKGKVLKNGTDYTVTYSAGRKNIGSYNVKITFKGNYSGTVTKTFKINPKATTGVKATKAATSIKLTWTKQSGVEGYQIYDTAQKKIVATVKGADKNSVTISKLTAGKAYIYQVRAYKTVGGTKYYGAYSTALKTSTLPATPAIASVTSPKAKNLTVKWGKAASATGYEIQYSTDKTFKKSVTTKIVSKNATISATYSGLATGKTYYVRIRTYKTISGAKVYSPYTAAKSVKIK